MNECDQETEQRSGYGDMQVGIFRLPSRRRSSTTPMSHESMKLIDSSSVAYFSLRTQK